MRNQTVLTKLATDGQKDDIRTTVLHATSTMLQSMTFAEAESIQSDKSVLNNAITRALEPFIRTKSVQYWFDQWSRFYQEVFGLECDYSELRAPASQEGFGWLVAADHRISTQQAFEKCLERFGAWKYYSDSLDKAIPTNDRSEKNGDYAVWFRDRVEADEEHKSKSANSIWTAALTGCTVRERLLLELFYEWKNPGKHLDLQNITICTGSRYSDGDVPDVLWSSDGRRGVVVSAVDPGSANGYWRCREVVP